MNGLVWAQVRAFAVPFGTMALATVAVMALTGRAEQALWLACCGALLLAGGSGLARARAAQVVHDLDGLTKELAISDLPDLTSLHPTTDTGRGIADSLSDLLDRVQSAVVEEDRLRKEINTAQQLRVSFVASMGHDLRGPLNSMLGFAELLLMDEQQGAQRQRPSVQTIRQRTLDLLTLIDEMLDWAKLEAGSLTLNRKRLAATELADLITELAEQRSAGRGLNLKVTVAAAAPDVRVDERHLPRAVVAALGDAIRGPSKGVVTMHMSGDRAGRLLLVLHDPTLLIRDEDQAQFFEAFRPSYAPSGKRIAGLGLGAACAKSLFVAHGGDVTFVSTVGDGTRFFMVLPSADGSS